MVSLKSSLVPVAYFGAAVCLFTVVGCGGGGGGSSSDESYAGVWDASITARENTCDLEEVGAVNSPVWQVDQNGSEIVVRNLETDSVSTGSLDDDGFTATRSTSAAATSGCTVFTTNYSIKFGQLDGDSTSVDYHVEGACDGVSTCVSDYQGFATRR